VVQTAASVDGYTDNLSVVLRDGVKRTIPSRWPSVVLSDTTTIAQAPDRLTASGYGEVQSTFCAPADWYLACVFGLDDSFHLAPGDLVAAVRPDLERWPPAVARRDPAALEQLIRLLAVRGLAGGIVGTTACLSGTEHLVSHMLDMFHDAHDLPVGLHGAQVGVGSVISAAAWEHTCSPTSTRRTSTSTRSSPTRTAARRPLPPHAQPVHRHRPARPSGAVGREGP
jgi:glycerol-1-phosphate dehydrogenase [NAD(P)+]